MSFSEVQKEALALSEKERASLAATLLDTLPAPGTDISDEEVLLRDADLESGRCGKFPTTNSSGACNVNAGDEGGLSPGRAGRCQSSAAPV
jgi:hypothetical protein